MIERFVPQTAESASSPVFRVLHVDDDPAVLRLSKELLSQAGVEVTGTTDPTVVAELLATESIDLVVSDYEMAELNGNKLYQEIHAAHPNVLFILFTAKEPSEVADEESPVDETMYVQKRGIGAFNELMDRITTILGRASA
jgi:DNA-binding NtrC family response regulator